MFVCEAVGRTWHGGCGGGGEFPCWGQKPGDCSTLIRPVSAAFLRPGFPHLSTYLSVCQGRSAHTNVGRGHTQHAGKVFQSGWESALCCKRQTWNRTRTQSRVTAVTHQDGGEACRGIRERVNPPAVAFPLWICVRLNFSRGGWRGAIGHSVNVSGSEQPEPRQPLAVACHSLCLCLGAVYFLLPRPPYPALSHTFIVVFLPLPRHCLQENSTSCNRRGWF